MDRTGQSKNTFKLVYEFNNNSCLFARLAALEIEDKDYTSAIEILEKGIKKFPSYPTAQFIYSIALAYQGKVSEAISSVEKTKDYFTCQDTIDFYLRKIEQINKDQNSLKESTRFSFVPNSFSEEPEEEIFENKLQSIAEKLKSAKITINNPIAGDIRPREESAPTRQIVSETMAGILLAQGKPAEAIAVYEELILADPARKEYFQLRIEEIKAQPSV